MPQIQIAHTIPFIVVRKLLWTTMCLSWVVACLGQHRVKSKMGSYDQLLVALDSVILSRRMCSILCLLVESSNHVQRPHVSLVHGLLVHNWGRGSSILQVWNHHINILLPQLHLSVSRRFPKPNTGGHATGLLTDQVHHQLLQSVTLKKMKIKFLPNKATNCEVIWRDP